MHLNQRLLSGFARLSVGVVLGLLVVLGYSAAASAADNPPLVVNDSGDRDDVSGNDGVCQTSTGTCTLRAAISQANYNQGSDVIHFNIPGSNTHRITLGSDLPSLVDLSGGVYIDGYTQPGSAQNTSGLTFNASIKIEIDGESTNNAFTIEAPENTIRGLTVYGAAHQIEMRNENADGNVVVGNILGTDNSFTYERGGGIGVLMNTGPDQNTVGTPALGDRNVISGNGGQGIRINHGESSQNIIQNNIIGMDASGTQALRQSIGIDLQFWTWGNLIGGNGANEGNLLSGNTSGGMDFSHSATGNSVLGNRIGTLPDGNSATTESGNRNGVIIKDNPTNNYIGNNIISGNDSDGVWHKHNYTGRNTFVNNRIGVGSDGAAIGNGNYGVFVTGHDDIYFNNIIANNGDGGVNINNNTTRNNANYPDELTERNAFRLGGYYNNNGPIIEIEDTDEHPSQNQPTITGVGSGEVYGGETCPGCTIDIYASGTVSGDGTVSVGPTPGINLRLIATHSGRCLDIQSNSNSDNAPALQGDCDNDAAQQFTMIPDGTGFALRVNQSGKCLDLSGVSQSNNAAVVQFTCNGQDNQTLRWSGNSLVFAHSGKCLDIQNGSTSDQARAVQQTCSGSDSQRFHPGNTVTSAWIGTVIADGSGNFSMASSSIQPDMLIWATSLTQNGETSEPSGHVLVSSTPYNLGSNPGSPGPIPSDPPTLNLPPRYVPDVFECSAANGTLSWDDAGASQYFIFATTNGQDTYLGGHTATSLAVPGADSYRITHWLAGFATTANCDGPGPDVIDPFSCSADNGMLTWDDAGASEYFVFATTNGQDTYLGGHTGPSLAVPGADSYRITHWLGGRTVADCDGPGPDVVDPFSCSADDGILTWDDAGASTYYVHATTDGQDTYLGGHAGPSLAVAGADSYRITHWLGGQNTATCNGPGPDIVPAFSCTIDNGALSWDDAGANDYYVFATTNGEDIYLGGHSTTSLSVIEADSYRVTHWLDGKTTAVCPEA